MSANRVRWSLMGAAVIALLAYTPAHAASVDLSSDPAFALFLKDFTAPDDTAVNLVNGTSQATAVGIADGITVNFSSPVVGGLTSAGGAATITPTTADFYTSLTILAPGYFFDSLEFGVQLPKDNTTLSITAFFSDGHSTTETLTSLSETDGIKDNANNSILALAAEGETHFTSIVLTSDLGINQTKQYEISGLIQDPGGASGETPIPGAVFLFGSVLAGGVGLIRRKRSSLRIA